jgi:hypothetical protein
LYVLLVQTRAREEPIVITRGYVVSELPDELVE